MVNWSTGQVDKQGSWWLTFLPDVHSDRIISRSDHLRCHNQAVSLVLPEGYSDTIGGMDDGGGMAPRRSYMNLRFPSRSLTRFPCW